MRTHNEPRRIGSDFFYFTRFTGVLRGILRVGRVVFGQLRRKTAYDKFLQKVANRGLAGADGAVFEGYPPAIAICGWVIEFGDATRGKAAGNRRNIELPMAVIAFAHE